MADATGTSRASAGWSPARKSTMSSKNSTASAAATNPPPAPTSSAAHWKPLKNNHPTRFVHYGRQTLLPSSNQIPPRGRHLRPAHLPAGGLAPLLAGVADDGNSFRTDVCGRNNIDGEES